MGFVVLHKWTGGETGVRESMIKLASSPFFQVTKRVITRTEPDEEDDRISSTISVIYFTLPTSSYGPTFIKCRATLYDIYADASITRIQPRIPSSNSNSRKVLEVPNSLQHSSAQIGRYLSSWKWYW